MSKIELREASSGKLILHGYPSMFNVWYPIGPGMEEKIAPGAFRRTLGEDPDVALLVEHGGLPLARTRRGSSKPNLNLAEDTKGLFAEAELNVADPRTVELRAVTEHSDLQMSFAFQCTQEEWNEDYSRRVIQGVGLHRGDVTICTFGANEETSMSLASRAASTAGERRALADTLGSRMIGPSRGITRHSNRVSRGRMVRAPDYTTGARQELDYLKARRS